MSDVVKLRTASSKQPTLDDIFGRHDAVCKWDGEKPGTSHSRRFSNLGYYRARFSMSTLSIG
jgi:hypothetical protein